MDRIRRKRQGANSCRGFEPISLDIRTSEMNLLEIRRSAEMTMCIQNPYMDNILKGQLT